MRCRLALMVCAAFDPKLTSKLRLRRIRIPIASTHKIHTLCLAQDWSAAHGND
jgi:hypothetical protein